MSDLIYSYTQDQAIEDGYLYKLSDDLIITVGVFNLKGKGFTDGVKEDYLFEKTLSEAVIRELEKQPDKSCDGGNDKDFFTLIWRGTKFFVVRNETNGLTVMLPEEY